MPPASKTITVASDQAGLRLDIFLSEHLGVSRSQVQKMIGEKRVTVNNKLPKKSGDRLPLDAKIKISEPLAAKTLSPTKPTVIKPPTKKFTYADIKIITQTPDYFIISKPAGMLTHSTLRGETDSLAELLRARHPELAHVGEDAARPGIVHRLDKEASGLLVIARTPAMFECLKNQFKQRLVEKAYAVLCHGRVAKDEDSINFPIKRGRGDRMVSLPPTRQGQSHEEGKSALTDFLVEKRFVNFTLLNIKIHTGRMHQIRVHLLAYNHPVVGDPIYFQKKRKRAWDEKLGRLFLHCVSLGFRDLEGQWQTFETPLPSTLANFLTLLK